MTSSDGIGWRFFVVVGLGKLENHPVKNSLNFCHPSEEENFHVFSWEIGRDCTVFFVCMCLWDCCWIPTFRLVL